jgi:hypothetical protein
MAERPVFVPSLMGSRLVHEVSIQFAWSAGMAPSQKKKNVAALHAAAAKRHLEPLLEISSKSEREIGQKLSAFNLKIKVNGQETSFECAYQGSKVFEKGGPFIDLYWVDSREAKRDPRLQSSGRLIGFEFDGEEYPLNPPTVFYDWLYINAIYPHRDWLERLSQCAGFTDIEFNPQRSLNCQARSCATFVALLQRGVLDDAMESFSTFRHLLESGTL